jgi:small GTP-binding protein
MTDASKATEPVDCIYKVIFIGTCKSGKTSYLQRLTKNKYSDKYNETIGIDFGNKTVELPRGTKIGVEIFDLSGNTRFSAVTSSYIRGAVGALLMCDVTDKTSWDEVPNIVKAMKEQKGEDLPVVIVGTKADLDHERQVSKIDAYLAAGEYDFPYVETSAKEGMNIEEAITRLVQFIYDSNNVEIEDDLTLEEEIPLAQQQSVGFLSRISCCWRNDNFV